jgi:hypothetical protein
MASAVCETDALPAGIAEHLIATVCAADAPAVEWKLRLLKADAEESGFWAQPVERLGASKLLPPSGSAVKVAIHPDHNRLCFDSILLRHDKHYWLTEQVMLEAVLLKWPDQIQAQERRAQQRYPVSDDCRLHAQMCVTEGGAFGIKAPARLIDLSRSGAGLALPVRSELRHVQPGQTLRVEIHYIKGTLSIPARFTDHRGASGNNTMRFGVRFDPDGTKWQGTAPQALEEIVADLVRRQAARNKAKPGRARVA